MAADAASALLPVWMSQEQQPPPAGEHQLAQQPDEAAPMAAPPAVPASGSASASDAAVVARRELRAAAEAAAAALQRAGIPGRLMQLSFGDYIVVFDCRAGDSSSSRRRGEGSQAAVVPAPVGSGRASVNAPEGRHHLIGAALVASRVLAARGVASVPYTGGEVSLLAACAELRQ